MMHFNPTVTVIEMGKFARLWSYLSRQNGAAGRSLRCLFLGIVPVCFLSTRKMFLRLAREIVTQTHRRALIADIVFSQ